MAAGKFVKPEDIEVPPSTTFANDTQVALGSEHGAIYIMYNFKVSHLLSDIHTPSIIYLSRSVLLAKYGIEKKTVFCLYR